MVIATVYQRVETQRWHQSFAILLRHRGINLEDDRTPGQGGMVLHAQLIDGKAQGPGPGPPLVANTKPSAEWR